jgi:hypothetical protein
MPQRFLLRMVVGGSLRLASLAHDKSNPKRLDILAGVLAFVALMAARHYFTESGFLEEKTERH